VQVAASYECMLAYLSICCLTCWVFSAQVISHQCACRHSSVRGSLICVHADLSQHTFNSTCSLLLIHFTTSDPTLDCFTLICHCISPCLPHTKIPHFIIRHDLHITTHHIHHYASVSMHHHYASPFHVCRTITFYHCFTFAQLSLHTIILHFAQPVQSTTTLHSCFVQAAIFTIVLRSAQPLLWWYFT